MVRRPVLFAMLALVAGGCGSATPSSSPTAGSPLAVTTTAPAPTVSAPVVTTTPGPPKQPFKIALTTDGHSPTVGRPWHFTVRVTDLHGRQLSGTVKPHVLLSGRVIDTIGWFGFSGIFRHDVVWTADKKGQPLVFRVEVDANGGAKNVDYPILVK